MWRRSQTWPVTLRDDSLHEAPGGALVLRPLTRGDREEWMDLREHNLQWLDRWEATLPPESPGHRSASPRRQAPTFSEYVRLLDRAGRDGTTLPFAIELDGELVGQLTVSSITYGSMCSASIGYWVSEHVAGRSIAPTAVALAADHCFVELGLHRIEVNVRPENAPSLRVVAKLGLRDEGLRLAYLHIQGRWCDHRSFAVTAEEVPDGLLARWRGRR